MGLASPLSSAAVDLFSSAGKWSAFYLPKSYFTILSTISGNDSVFSHLGRFSA